jgi:plastocyanin
MAKGTGVAAVAVLALAASAAGVATADQGVHASASRATLSADPGGALMFNKRRLHARHGRVTIVMKNPSSSGISHGIAVEGNGVDKDGKIVSPGSTSRLRLKLKPGKYTFYCPVAGHRGAGMKGRLTVK